MIGKSSADPQKSFLDLISQPEQRTASPQQRKRERGRGVNLKTVARDQSQRQPAQEADLLQRQQMEGLQIPRLSSLDQSAPNRRLVSRPEQRTIHSRKPLAQNRQRARGPGGGSGFECRDELGPHPPMQGDATKSDTSREQRRAAGDQEPDQQVSLPLIKASLQMST